MKTASERRADAEKIFSYAVKSCSPYERTYEELYKLKKDGKIKNPAVLAVGKAACPMAKAACGVFTDSIKFGFALTKYGYGEKLPYPVDVLEGAHPVPDENDVINSRKALLKTDALTKSDCLIFLVSGGGSALFEDPKIILGELKKVNEICLKSGCPIDVLNAVRKRLSNVKGGKFAERTKAEIFCLALSDFLGDRPDVIASGPCFPDMTTDDELKNRMREYNLDFGGKINNLLFSEKKPKNKKVYYKTVGSVKNLCESAAFEAEKSGYKTEIVTDSITGEAADKGILIAEKALSLPKNRCLIYGGETTVTVRGKGKGGRAQELCLAAAEIIRGKEITVLSAGSDGTDGPTDAAGAVADGQTADEIGDIGSYIENNDSYNAFKKCGGLIITGATGTNVNDIIIVLT